MITERRSARFPGARAFLVAAAVIGSGAPPAALAASAQAPSADGTLMIVVEDPSGASVPGAEVVVERLGGGSDGAPVVSRTTEGGVAAVRSLPPGIYRATVRAPGFETEVLADVRVVASREARHRVRLRLEVLRESVDVALDPRTRALDPRGFSTFLSREQIDALPDDPEAFVQALQDWAPPGAIVRVDGFTGGPLPPKSQILSIRLPRLDTYAAQDHGGLEGGAFIDIVTRPGGGRVHGAVEGGFRHPGLAARNPIAGARGPESVGTATFALDGPIVPGRASFAVAVRGSTVQEAAAIRAALPGGHVLQETVVRPQDALTASGRVAAAVGRGHTLRLSFSSERRQTRNLGAGDVNLRERAYDSMSTDAAVRLAAGGPLGRRSFVESRVQLEWSGWRTDSQLEAPAERVLEAFTSGGAQVTGGARSMRALVAVDADHARGAHAWRTGVLVERDRQTVNRRANYLGTYMFASLEDYAAGRPATYTRRVGDGRLAFAHPEFAIYVQDDFRAARSLLLSYGVRYERQSLGGVPAAVLPRVGLAWSPSPRGRMTIRAGAGEFADWVGRGTVEQALLVDGVRQYDVLHLQPPYPAPPDAGLSAPRERYLLAPDLRLPRSRSASVGVEQLVPGRIRVSGTYVQRAGRHLLRGQNLNPPLGGGRPDPAFGNVVAARSDARSRTRSLTLQVITLPGGRWFEAGVSYMFTASASNTAGPFALPAAGNGPEDEWGATAPAHVVAGSFSASPFAGLRISSDQRWHSGLPYTITTGADDNGDGLFVDRPAGMPRNGARTPSHLELGARLSYVWQLGAARDQGLAVPSAGGDATSVRAGSISAAGAAAGTGRYRIEIYASVRNLANRPHYVTVGSVQGSPFFGAPTGAINPRRIDLGVRFGF